MQFEPYYEVEGDIRFLRNGESLKARPRREREGFFDLYCKGLGIDIGCGKDPLNDDVDQWDELHGDAHYMNGIDNETYDFVYSSHCLEHMEDPVLALQNWFRIVKRGGYMILYVPHRDRYELKKNLPSKWNADHKLFLLPHQDEPPHTWSVHTLLSLALMEQGELPYHIEYIRTCDEGWADPKGEHPYGEYSIEVVLKKL